MTRGPSAEFLAQRLLAHECRPNAAPADLCRTAGAIYLRLHRELSRLIGGSGCDLLLARALSVAGAAHPFLQGVRWQPGGEGPDEPGGLAERLQGQDPDTARAACTAVLSAFLTLLSSFIGHDLTTRQVRRAFPDVDLETGAEPD